MSDVPTINDASENGLSEKYPNVNVVGGGGGGGGTGEVKVTVDDTAGYLLDKISFDSDSGLSGAYDDSTKTLKILFNAADSTTQVMESYPFPCITNTHIKLLSSTGGNYSAVGVALTLNNKFKWRAASSFHVLTSQGTISHQARFGIYKLSNNVYTLVAQSQLFTASTTGKVSSLCDLASCADLVSTDSYYLVLFLYQDDINNLYTYGTDSSILTLGSYQPCPVIKVAGNITSIGTLPSTLSNVQNGEAIFYAKVVY